LRAWAEVIASMLAFSTSWWDIVEETARNEKGGQPQSIYMTQSWFANYAELACDSSMFVLTTSTE